MATMDLDGPVSIPHRPLEKTAATILCHNCGAPIDGTKAAGALCSDCIKLTIDISSGIQRDATLHMCRDCDRWLAPPAQWVVAAPESRELLAICLRKLRGLNKVRIIDASFIWTEPHSRRIRCKITIQQEAFQGTILQQTFQVEYVQANQQCPDCKKSYTHNTWRAVVQVRQKVPHKRTFLFLEQLILKHNAHRDTINIKEVHDGIDFYFAHKNQSEKFVDFLNSVTPVKTKKSQELISTDTHSGTASYKFSYSCELVPICKDDLVALPIKLANQIGNIHPLTLCYKIGTSVYLLDPNTLQTADVSTPIYWRAPFSPIADVQDLVEFTVMDISPLGPTRGKHVLAEATVVKTSDFGVNDTSYQCRTHLGAILNYGDTVMGYLLAGTQFNNDEFEAIESHKSFASSVPDVVLVKKSYPRRVKKTGDHSASRRNWKLKRMAREETEMAPRKQDQEKLERDFEMFLRDVEEDEELRLGMALYKDQKASQNVDAKANEMQVDGEEDLSDDSDEDEQRLRIPMDQLLDEFEEMKMES